MEVYVPFSLCRKVGYTSSHLIHYLQKRLHWQCWNVMTTWIENQPCLGILLFVVKPLLQPWTFLIPLLLRRCTSTILTPSVPRTFWLPNWLPPDVHSPPISLHSLNLSSIFIDNQINIKKLKKWNLLSVSLNSCGINMISYNLIFLKCSIGLVTNQENYLDALLIWITVTHWISGDTLSEFCDHEGQPI